MNKSEIRFAASWSRSVKVITTIVVVVSLSLAAASFFVMPDKIQMPVKLAVFALPSLILIGTLPFVVKGYVVTERELFIERLGWRNRIPLREVVSVTVDPEAMNGSLRLCGSGGLFGFFG